MNLGRSFAELSYGGILRISVVPDEWQKRAERKIVIHGDEGAKIIYLRRLRL